MQKWNSLPYFHGLFIVVAEEIIGLVSSDGLSAVHAQVKHCKWNKDINSVSSLCLLKATRRSFWMQLQLLQLN